MKIREHVNLIRNKAKSIKNYQSVSKECGVSYEWLAKFSQGKITNPTIDNIAKLEIYFDELNSYVKTEEEIMD